MFWFQVAFLLQVSQKSLFLDVSRRSKSKNFESAVLRPSQKLTSKDEPDRDFRTKARN